MKPKRNQKTKGLISTREGKATVRVFNQVMISKLTQYDERLARSERKRGHVNIHRLPLLFQAAGRALARVPKDLADSDTVQALGAYKRAIAAEFIVSDMPPAKNVIKQLDEYLSTGKPPTIASTKRSNPTKATPKKNPAPGRMSALDKLTRLS